MEDKYERMHRKFIEEQPDYQKKLARFYGEEETEEDDLELDYLSAELENDTKDNSSFSIDYEQTIMDALRNGEGDKYGF